MSLKLKRQREWLAKRSRQPKGAFPLGTLVWYGPTDRVASKAAAAVFIDDGEEPAALERWWQPAFDIRDDADVTSAIVGFFQSHQVKRVASVDRILGCPHEEGIDYPEGSTCPTCTFWAGRDRLTGALPVASPDERTETGGPGRSHDSAASPSMHELVHSPLCRRLTVEGRHLDVQIYGDRPDQWILEAVTESGTSIVWDDPFPTDQAALDELLRTIEEEGAAAFEDDRPPETDDPPPRR